MSPTRVWRRDEGLDGLRFPVPPAGAGGGAGAYLVHAFSYAYVKYPSYIVLVFGIFQCIRRAFREAASDY